MSMWMPWEAGLPAASLPALGWMQLWLRLGWAVVLAALVVGLWGCLSRRRGGVLPALGVRVSAALVLLVCLLPQDASPAFWLGLAFQAPSLGAGVLAALVLARHGLLGARWMAGAQETLRQCADGALGGVLLGWVLLLDSFAVWPVFFYPSGFGPGAWLVVLVLATVGWAWQGSAWRAHRAALVVLAVWGLFGLTRLPSGNVWDALLDPWLFGLCHVMVVADCWRRYKKRS